MSSLPIRPISRGRLRSEFAELCPAVFGIGLALWCVVVARVLVCVGFSVWFFGAFGSVASFAFLCASVFVFVGSVVFVVCVVPCRFPSFWVVACLFAILLKCELQLKLG